MRPEGRGWRILCAALPVFLSFFLSLFYTSPPLFNTSPLFFLHRLLICFFFFLSLLSPSFSPFLLLPAFFSLCLSPLSSLPLLFFLKSTAFSSSAPVSLPAYQFLLFEGIACTVFIEGIACSVCIEGIACTVCI